MASVVREAPVEGPQGLAATGCRCQLQAVAGLGATAGPLPTGVGEEGQVAAAAVLRQQVSEGPAVVLVLGAVFPAVEAMSYVHARHAIHLRSTPHM